MTASVWRPLVARASDACRRCVAPGGHGIRSPVLQPGMVFSVEPGLYVPRLGGFRHSDTVALTDGGIEVLTPYPRQLDDVIVDPR